MRCEAKIHRTLDNSGIVKFIGFHEIHRTVSHQETKEECDILEAHRVSHYILMEHA